MPTSKNANPMEYTKGPPRNQGNARIPRPIYPRLAKEDSHFLCLWTKEGQSSFTPFPSLPLIGHADHL